MTHILTLFVLLLTPSSNGYQLEIKVENIKSQQGIIKVCIFDNEADFFGKALKCIEVRPGTSSHVTVRFKDLPPGTYAAVAYHDINENGRLDRNFLGIPSEPYAFSNNPSTMFGPPSFSKAAFKLDRSVAIQIRL